jgi:hypothetical protein
MEFYLKISYYVIRAYWRTYINYYTFVRPNVFRAICGEKEKERIILFERKLLVVGTRKLKYRNLSDFIDDKFIGSEKFIRSWCSNLNGYLNN